MAEIQWNLRQKKAPTPAAAKTWTSFRSNSINADRKNQFLCLFSTFLSSNNFFGFYRVSNYFSSSDISGFIEVGGFRVMQILFIKLAGTEGVFLKIFTWKNFLHENKNFHSLIPRRINFQFSRISESAFKAREAVNIMIMHAVDVYQFCYKFLRAFVLFSETRWNKFGENICKDLIFQMKFIFCWKLFLKFFALKIKLRNLEKLFYFFLWKLFKKFSLNFFHKFFFHSRFFPIQFSPHHFFRSISS